MSALVLPQSSEGVGSAPLPEVVVVTVPAPVVPVERFLFVDLPGEIGLFSDHARESWSFAARGEVLRVAASGPSRFEVCRRGLDGLFAALREHGEPDGAPPLIALGGFAFVPGAASEGPFRAFGDGSFVLPRWLYARRGERAFLRFCFRSGEALAGPALAAELDRIMEALARAEEPTLEAPASPPRAERPSRAAYGALVERALAALRQGPLSKVVTAARAQLSATQPFDPRRVLARLRAAQPGCIVYGFERGDACFLGATPERLVTLSGRALETEAVAGSIACGLDASAAAAELLASDKEQREHTAVRRGIVEALGPLTDSLDVAEQPEVRGLASLLHLVTPVRGQAARARHVLDFVRALHPTPAVAGAPRDASLAWLREHEPFDRGWYASPVGYVDAEGDGAFVVALRSAVLEGREGFAYAGGGIVRGSEPTREHDEVLLKLRAMFAALGVAP
jgi:isochorismate synthase